MDLYDTTDENTKARQKDDKKEVEKEENPTRNPMVILLLI
jgi:hypothetical protein